MRKLSLDVAGLAVESFPVTAEAPVFRGTVQGADMATQALGCTRGETCRTSCGRVGDCTCPLPV